MSVGERLSGFLNIDKPAGVTSRRVVDHVVRLVRPAKAGHAGTLDPLATGVLIVAVGQGTRLIQYVQRQDKEYLGTFLLGRVSDTEDVEGHVTLLGDRPPPSLAQLQAAAARLTGEIQQRPPAYSALKVQGRRAYDLARAGESPDLAPRPVMIYELEIVAYEYPELQLRVRCGSGTYVRSLGRDLAEAVESGAVMSALVRTRIGPFMLPDASKPDEVTRENVAARLAPLARAVGDLPVVRLESEALLALSQGRVASWPAGRRFEADSLPADAECAVFDPAGGLAAIARPLPQGLRAVINLAR